MPPLPAVKEEEQADRAYGNVGLLRGRKGNVANRQTEKRPTRQQEADKPLHPARRGHGRITAPLQPPFP